MCLRFPLGVALLAALGLWIAPADDAAAQVYAYPPPYYGYGYHHASTVEEGVARGLSSIIRSAGEASLLASEAAKNFEEARSMNLDNRIKATQTWFELRRINREERYGSFEAPTSEQLFRINQARLPDRLSASQLDPVTGAIDWPAALRVAAFAEDRAEIERALAAHAAGGSPLSVEEYAKIRETLARFESTLPQYVESIPTSQYIRATSFLKSLAYEADLAAR
jgi:hypothetical protein